MNIWFKVGLGALVGFAGGVATGYFIHKKINDVEFEEISTEEMALLEKQAEGQQRTEPKEPVSEAVMSSKARVESVQDLPSDQDKMRLALQGKTSYLKADQEAKERYAKIWGTVHDYSDEDNANELPVPLGEDTEETDPDNEFDEGFLKDISQEIDDGSEGFSPNEPYEIDLPDFYDESNGYDKITIGWYEPMVFVDENEEIIADISTYIGDIDINKLFIGTDFSDDPDCRFVRNEGYSTDYEIIRHHRTWTETTGEGG